MNTRSLLKSALVMAVLATTSAGSAFAAGKTWKASVAQMPVLSESKDKGVWIDLLKALAKASGDTIEIEVVPFARSMANLMEGRADFHLPLLQVPGSPNGREKFDYSTDGTSQVNFVAYITKTSSVTVATLRKANVETEAAHLEFFDFPVRPSTNIENSLKKVDAGRIDAFIFADTATDPVLKSTKLPNVKRELYARFDVKFVLPKGGNGGATDKFLSQTIAKLRASGEWQKVTQPLNIAYDNWQP